MRGNTGMYVDPRRSNPGRGYRSGGPAVANAAQVDEEKGMSTWQALAAGIGALGQISGALGGTEAAGGTTSGGNTSGGTNNTGSLNIQKDINQNPHLNQHDLLLGKVGGEVDTGTWDGNQWQSRGEVKPPDEVRPPSQPVPKQPDQSDTTPPPTLGERLKDPATQLKIAEITGDLANKIAPGEGKGDLGLAIGNIANSMKSIKGILEQPSEGGDDNEEEEKQNQMQAWYLRNPQLA